MDLEYKKKKILAKKNQSIKLKSRAIWLLHGDGNMKYFHNFYPNRLSINTIWQLDNGAGLSVSGFDDLAAACSQHFSSLFKED